MITMSNSRQASPAFLLVNTGEIDQKWAWHTARKYIHPGSKVCILAFSFFDNVQCQQDWEKEYGPTGMWYRGYTAPLARLGIKEGDITFLSPFRDGRNMCIETIYNSDVLVLTGGAPELFMKRIKDKGLKKTVRNFSKTIVGVSAGAMILLEDYHISPDEDYSEFGWYKGLGMVPGIDIEPHFKGTKAQTVWMERAMEEKHIPTFAIWEQGGLLIVDGEVRPFGKVDEYRR